MLNTLFPCFIFSVSQSLYFSLFLSLLRFTLCCTFFMFHFFCVALPSYCMLFMLYYFHVAVFSCFDIFMSHFYPVALFNVALFILHYFHVTLVLCCSFLVSHYFCGAPSSVLHYFSAAFLVLHSFQINLSSYCTRSILHCNGEFFEKRSRKHRSDCLFFKCCVI